MSSPKVLFIEDDTTLRQFAAIALTDRGIHVHSVSNTVDADKILKEESIDVIVCDILMPAENGLSYIRRLRSAGHRTPVIFLSALAEADVVKIGMATGASDYMTKPFHTEDLYRRIMSQFRRSEIRS